MPVLVTGAGGFLGGRLAQVLAARGTEIRILARETSDLRHLDGCGCEVLRGGLLGREILDIALRGATYVYNCAGCSTDWAPWAEYYEANVAGVRGLLEAAAGRKTLRRFLHVSTTDVYGYPERACDESHPLTDIGLPYNRSKCMGEEAAWHAWRDGVPVTVVRPATIYGPRGKVFAADVARLIRTGMMAVIGGGRSRGGFCYVDNAVDAIIAAAEAPCAAGRAYNVADGTGETWRAYVDRLADGLGERRPWIDIPASLAFPLARILEAAPGRPLLTRHAVYVLSRDQEYETRRARSELGFSPAVSFTEGVARTVGWLRAG